MSKILPWLLKGFLILTGILILAFIGVFTYVSLNKKKIIGLVTQEIGTKLNGKVDIRDVELSFFRNFPEVSVLLHDVSITDTLFSAHRHPLLQAEEVFVNISFWKLIKSEPPLKGLQLEGGTVYLFTDSTGYTNTYLLNPRRDTVTTTAKTPYKNELKSILLKDMNIVISDARKEKLYNFMVTRLDAGIDSRDSSSFLFAVRADLLVKSLAFNLQRGSFLKDKTFTGRFDIKFLKKTNRLVFDSIDVNIAGHPLNLSGSFDLKGNTPQFALRLHVRKILYPFVRSLLPAQLNRNLSIVDVDKPVDGDAVITGPLKGGDPRVYITWSARNAKVKTPFLDFEDASFEGYFTNEVVAGRPRKDPNSKIEVNHFKARWHGLSLSSNRIEILNLYKPLLTCDLGSHFELKTLNDIIGSEAIRFNEGAGSIQVLYKGPIEKNNNTNSLLNGAVSFSNASILYTPRNVEMKQVNGKLTFRNSDVFVENLQCLVMDNLVTMQGRADNLLTLINTQPGKANIDWNIYTPSLNLGSFMYLLQPRNKKTQSKRNNNRVSDMADKIDNLMEQCTLQVTLKADKLLYKKFEASRTIADIKLLENKYVINKLSMDHAGGHIEMNGSLVHERDNYNSAKIRAALQHVEVNKVFAAFEDFGQDGIVGENLEGKLTANVEAAMIMDDKGALLPSGLVSKVDFSLKDGALNNYEPLKKLQRFVFKKRDFDNIRFAELKNTLEINNGEIKINRMEIQSSVLSLFVEGLYSQTGKTDMSIQVPLNNLKKRDEDYNPENVGTETKRTGSVYIRGRPGEDGNIKFKLDLFNRYSRDKENALMADSLNQK